MSVKVKICGITNEQDAVWAANLGADYVGFNFYGQSPRKVSPAQAAAVRAKLPPFVLPVGVFVNEKVDAIVKIVQKAGLKGVQLHGDETPQDCQALKDKLGPGVFIMKAARVSEAAHVEALAAYKDACDYFLLDARSDAAPGGTGDIFPWDLAAQAKVHGVAVFAAGGLTPDNVSKAIKATQPFAVDVASGVEKTPKRKDYDKMKSFIDQVKRTNF
jgi:phosphoribosylanthranilate isomerase